MAPRIGVFHPGTQHSWQTALAFQENRQLAWYATSVFYDPKRWPYRLERIAPQALARRLHRDFSRRYLPALDREHVRQFGFWEWIETGARRVRRERLASWANRRGNASFGTMVTRLIEREPVDVLWGYNTSSVEVFRWAKPRGIRCILDQTIGHCASMNRVMLAEQARNPEFFLRSYAPFSAAAIEQQEEEIALADVVVVGSDYCARTLIENGCPSSKIRIIPYGFDETLFPREQPIRRLARDAPIEFLFVGLICPRKGVAALLQAFETIPRNEARLTLIGRLEIPEQTFRRFRDKVTHIDSVPRAEVVKHFLKADCFVFPSLFEGGGIVLYEAGGAGLGIIQSAYCGDGVRNDRNGEILTDVSPDRLRAAVASVIDNPQRLAAWQQASWDMRADRTWQHHREQVRALVPA
jgi:glycosyltransferase involved in cell wall biosynthesis